MRAFVGAAHHFAYLLSLDCSGTLASPPETSTVCKFLYAYMNARSIHRTVFPGTAYEEYMFRDRGEEARSL